MSNKSKGSKAERELLDLFIKDNFRCVRVAGSGVMENSDADLIAGKIGQKYAIEVKSTKKTSKYITKEQMSNFIVFSEIFGLTPVIAVRFNRIGWFFLNPNDLEDSGKNWVINMELIRIKGKRFAQFFDRESISESIDGDLMNVP
jgi:Holliday junction resolvase